MKKVFILGILFIMVGCTTLEKNMYAGNNDILHVEINIYEEDGSSEKMVSNFLIKVRYGQVSYITTEQEISIIDPNKLQHKNDLCELDCVDINYGVPYPITEGVKITLQPKITKDNIIVDYFIEINKVKLESSESFVLNTSSTRNQVSFINKETRVISKSLFQKRLEDSFVAVDRRIEMTVFADADYLEKMRREL